ncbi:nitrate ABC transporter substrate-binding protein [Sinorhizobium meliloti]|nr:nitrate ABC transporter substrate-binding protein [Sinorhizobium meliloti]
MNQRPLPRRSALKSIAGIACALALPALGSPRAHAQTGTKDVNLQLGWLPGGDQLGEIVAQHLGYFEDEGLNLKIQPGGPSVDGVAMVASGGYEIGQVTSSPSLMMAASQGIPVKCFAVGLQEHPHTFFSLPRQPIKRPRDMVGRKIGIQATGKVLLSALLKKNGLSESDIEIITIGSDYTPLLTGQVDAVAGWITNVKALKPLGDELVTLRLWDFGVRLYALPYYTTEATLKNDPELLAAFLRAAGKGWGYARENPERAVEILVRAVSNLDEQDQLASAGAMLNFAFNEQTKEQGWGSFSDQVWQDQISLYNELGQFSGGTPDLDNVRSRLILDATSDARPKLA